MFKILFPATAFTASLFLRIASLNCQIGKYANLLYICELNFFVAFRAKAGREEQNVEYNLINIHYK